MTRSNRSIRQFLTTLILRSHTHHLLRKTVVFLGLNTWPTQRLGHWKYRTRTFGQTFFFLETPKHRLTWTAPHSWRKVRQTEGWAGLQHHSVLHTVLTIFPPTNPDPNVSSTPPCIHVNLIQGSFFTILPKSGGNRVPKWCSGNIYSMERSLPRIIDFPSTPSLTSPTSYDIFVSGDYEVWTSHTSILIPMVG